MHRSLLASFGLLCSVGGAFGCSGDTLNGPPPLGPAKAYWALSLNQHAVALALTAQHDTVQLQVTPLNALGAPLAAVGPVTYTALDTTQVTVSPSGLVTARATTSALGTPVVATLVDTLHGVTHRDTVMIAVTSTGPPMPFQFSLQPVEGDSAKRAFDVGTSDGSAGHFSWPALVTDATGAPVTLPVYYTSSNPIVATIDPHTGDVQVVDTGHVVFTATTLAYGQLLRDSVPFTIGYRLNYTILIGLASQSGNLTAWFRAPKREIVGVGANVVFGCGVFPTANAGTPVCDHPVDVVFDHTDHVDAASFFIFPPTGSGDIPAFGGDTVKGFSAFLTDFRARQFSAPGTYRYHSTLFPSDTFELVISSLQ